MTVEIDRIAAHVPGSTTPCVWAADGDAAGFADAIAADRTVKELKMTADSGSGGRQISSGTC